MISTVAQFYDGKQPVARTVHLLGDERGLQILSAEDGIIFWDYENLREQGSDLKPDRMIVSPADDPSQFLSFENEALVQMVRENAKKHLQKNFSVTPAWAVKIWAGLGAVALFVILLMYLVIPWTTQYIAPILPYNLEASIGTAADETLTDFMQSLRDLSDDSSPITCDVGVQPLENIVADLLQSVLAEAQDNKDLAERVQEVGVPSVKIINSSIVNAVALPGGRILIFRGLLEEATEDFDTIAVILAHEMAHVMYRHNMRNVIGHSAATILLQSLIGDLLNSPSARDIAGIAVVSGYTLDMEKQADSVSVSWAKEAGFNPALAVKFFEYIDGRGQASAENSEIRKLIPEEIANIFATHPANADRIENLHQYATNAKATAKYGDYNKWLKSLEDSCPPPKS